MEEVIKVVVKCAAIRIKVPEKKDMFMALCTSTEEHEIKIKFLSKFAAKNKEKLEESDLIILVWNPEDVELNKEPLFQLENACGLIQRQNGVMRPVKPLVFVCIGDDALEQSRQVLEFATQQNIAPELFSVVASYDDFENAVRKYSKAPVVPPNAPEKEKEQEKEEESRFDRIAHSRKARIKNVMDCLKSKPVDEMWLLLMFDTTERGKRTSLLIEQYFAEQHHDYVSEPKVEYKDSECFKKKICFNALALRERNPDHAPVAEVLKLLDKEERAFPAKIVMLFRPSAKYIADQEAERQMILDIAQNMYTYINKASVNGAPVTEADIYGKYTMREVPDAVKNIAQNVFNWSESKFERPGYTLSEAE